MKRVLLVTTMFAAVVMLNGCTRCSQEQPPEAPPVVEPTEPPPGEMPPGGMEGGEAAPGMEGAPAGEQQPGTGETNTEGTPGH
ncbi:MAG: hypothetical protein AB7G93_07000 [Bdellovibrionales bacterium]